MACPLLKVLQAHRTQIHLGGPTRGTITPRMLPASRPLRPACRGTAAALARAAGAARQAQFQKEYDAIKARGTTAATPEPSAYDRLRGQLAELQGLLDVVRGR